MESSPQAASHVETLPELPPPYVSSVRPPPPYCELHESRLGLDTRRPSNSRTFDAIEENIASAKHSYEIRPRVENGFCIHRTGSNEPIYEVSSHIGPDTSTIMIWSQSQDNSAVIAEAKVPMSNHKCFSICLISTAVSVERHWIDVQCSEGGLLRSESFSFQTAGKPFAWKRTHSVALGSSRFAGHDLKLMDESRVGEKAHPHTKARQLAQAFDGERVIVGGDVIAVYTQHGTNGATASRHMQLDWLDEYGEHIEVSALITLMAILELSRIHGRSSTSGIRSRAKSLRSRAGSIRSSHTQNVNFRRRFTTGGETA